MRISRSSCALQFQLGSWMTMTALLVTLSGPVGAQTITEINPSQSTMWSSDPDGASGGRVNHVGVAKTSKSTMFAASEWGGIYESTDGGQTWARMNGHHPTVTWDVKVSPSDAKRVIATSFYDGKVNSQAGINVSTDGGVTWTHPASATPPAGFCFSSTARNEPAAHGIAFDPDHPQHVYVGTNCGLATSNDGGNTWKYVDPTPADPADNVWAVVVHHNGIIDTCGDDGHRRSTNGGATWTSTSGGGTPLSSGICSIAASPDESYVLFAVVGTTIFESDNGGGSWISGAYANPKAQGRIPFVKTNWRATNKYDLWFGDVSVFRGSCTTPSPAAPGGSKRCQPSTSWAGGFTRSNGGHDDMGDVAFDPSPGTVQDNQCQQDCDADRDECMKEVAHPGGPTPQQCVQELKACLAECKPGQPKPVAACPMIMSSDGGVFPNTLTTTPGCQTPKWGQPNVTPHGLWAFGMNGVHATGDDERLYLANQDDGTFATGNAQTNSPNWFDRDCCDAFDVAVDTNQVVYTVCCFGGRATRLFLRNAGMTGGGEINTYPAGDIAGWITPDQVDRFGNNSYVLLTSSGVFITTNITASPISWSQLGSRPGSACAVRAAVSGSTPSFFVQAGNCNTSGIDQVWRYNGTGTGSTWKQVSPPKGFNGFGIFTVDRKNPDRMFASAMNGTTIQMVVSTNGGTSWSNLSTLDTSMTGGGAFKYSNTSGPTDFTSFNGYVQPTLVAFSPFDNKVLVAAGADSGVFLSKDTGGTWTKVTDNAGTASNPHVPRAKFASFDRGGGNFSVYIGTQGRGAWRIDYPDPSGACQENCQNADKACVDGCDKDRDQCMKDAAKPGGPRPQECVQELKACTNECSTTFTNCKKKCG